MLIQPLTPNVLIEIEKVKSNSGFLIPEGDKDKQGYGVIKAVWSGCTRTKMGDKVFFKKYKPEKIVNEEGEFYLANEEDILAIYT